MLNRIILLVLVDIIAVFISLYVGVVLRFNSFNVGQYIPSVIATSILFTIFLIVTYYIVGLYRSLWRYASVEELIKLIFSSIMAIFVIFLINHIWAYTLPNSVFAIAFFMQVAISGSFRFSYRSLRVIKSSFIRKTYDEQRQDRIIVIGGEREAADTIKIYKDIDVAGNIVAIIDRFNKKGAYIHGVRIEGNLEELEKVIKDFNANEVILASKKITDDDLSYILNICVKLKCKLKKHTYVNDFNDKNMIVDINPKDLLGREQVILDKEELKKFINNKVILVTGGGGSIGSELIKQMAKYKPKQIVIVDMFENYAYLNKLALERKYSNIKVDVVIGSIRDKARMCNIFKMYKPDIVFHAAAHKHVSLMEYSPTEALKNNILGTYNIARCANDWNTKKMVLISTDKAVNPTNIMGATKRVAEIIISAFNQQSTTEYSAVRFGNVLDSSGSVVPIFKQQIEEGGPVRVTHPEITRYFMIIPEAASLVLQAGAMAKGEEIFILDMQKPIKIKDLAENLIRLYGFTPGVDIDIVYTGLRPGEKLYEELLHNDEAISTKYDKIFIAKSQKHSLEEVEQFLLKIKDAIKENKGLESIIKLLQEKVPEFKPLNIENINNELLEGEEK